MVLIEQDRPYEVRNESEYFYAWIRFKYSSTRGRISWDKGDDIRRVVKFLTLHRYTITHIALRKEYLSIEDEAMCKGYQAQLKDFIL